MGMFDTVNCEVPLPEPVPPRSGWLQTKDLGCSMDTFTIRKDGTLWQKGWGDLAEKQVPFHGILNFYTYEKDVWYEYTAKFTDGKLQGIEAVRAPDNPLGPQT